MQFWIYFFLILELVSCSVFTNLTRENNYNDRWNEEQTRILAQTKSTATEGEFTVGTIATVSWIINDDDTVEFTVKLNQICWFGVGFGSTMRNVDMFVIEVINSVASVKDLWSTGDYTPLTDTKQDYELISQSVTNGKVNISFKRKLNTGDSSQDTILVRGTTKTWNYAYRTSPSTMTREHSKYGKISNLEFGVGDVPSTPSQLTASQTKETETEGEFTVNTLATVNWLFKDDDSVDFTVTLLKKCWFAVGFGVGMTNVDMFVIQIENNEGTVKDLWSTSQNLPSVDSQQSLTRIAQSVIASQVQVIFNRKLNTGDTKDKILEKGKTYSWSWAYKSDELTMQTTHDQAQQISIIFGRVNSNSGGAATLPPAGQFTVSTLATIKWTFLSLDVVQFTIDLTIKCWFGLGFDRGMKNVDMLVVQIVNNKVEVLDLWSTGNQTPDEDAIQNFEIIDQSINGNLVSVTFTRKLNTGDTQDQVLVVGQTYTWGWGYRTDELVMQNQHSLTGSQEVKFGVEESDSSGTLSGGTSKTAQASDGQASLGQIAKLSWILSDNLIEFTLNLTEKCWFGMGFDKGMNNVDMLVINFLDNNKIQIIDLWSTSNSLPTIDDQQDYTLVSSNIQDSLTTVIFKRKLDTGDQNQDKILELGKSYNIGWAYLSGELVMTNQHDHTGEISITLEKKQIDNFIKIIVNFWLIIWILL